MSPKPRFEEFWSARDDGYEIAVNRWATSHAAALVAYISARLELTPNQVTLLSLVCGLVGFLLEALTVSTGEPTERSGHDRPAPAVDLDTLSPDQLRALARRQAERLAAHEHAASEPIAIVGMACRFPAEPTTRSRSGACSATAWTQSVRSRPVAG